MTIQAGVGIKASECRIEAIQQGINENRITGTGEAQ